MEGIFRSSLQFRNLLLDFTALINTEVGRKHRMDEAVCDDGGIPLAMAGLHQYPPAPGDYWYIPFF
jgi:hypothetical protein